MRLFRILSIGCLSVSVAVGNKTSNFVQEFLSMPDDKGDWNEETANHYLNQLVEKHGSKVQEQIDRVTQDENNAYQETVRNKKEHCSDRRWHVGDVTLTKLDKSFTGSIFGKLRESISLRGSSDTVSIQDFGIYFLGVTDTDIFEGLEEE